MVPVPLVASVAERSIATLKPPSGMMHSARRLTRRADGAELVTGRKERVTARAYCLAQYLATRGRCYFFQKGYKGTRMLLQAAGIEFRLDWRLGKTHTATVAIFAANQPVALLAVREPNAPASWSRTHAYLRHGLPVFACRQSSCRLGLQHGKHVRSKPWLLGGYLPG